MGGLCMCRLAGLQTGRSCTRITAAICNRNMLHSKSWSGSDLLSFDGHKDAEQLPK